MQDSKPRRCNSLHCGPARRTAVYRLYDCNQRLLYVGIAHDTKKRWREHARDKDWWSEVRWKTAVWHSSRLGAAIEEYCAYRYENPIYNKNREYDRRLGWEPGDAPGHHQPRPWRLRLLTSAMTFPDGGISWDDADPHHAVVKCANQDGAGEGRIRVWFPRAPELGYWYCVATSDAELHAAAIRVLTQQHGLEPGSFTLSVHGADASAEPTLEPWKDPAQDVEAPVEEEPAAIAVPSRPWWKKADVVWRTPRVALFVVEWWGPVTIGMMASVALDVYVASRYYSPGVVTLTGMASGLLYRALNKLANWWDNRPQWRNQ